MQDHAEYSLWKEPGAVQTDLICFKFISKILAQSCGRVPSTKHLFDGLFPYSVPRNCTQKTDQGCEGPVMIITRRLQSSQADSYQTEIQGFHKNPLFKLCLYPQVTTWLTNNVMIHVYLICYPFKYWFLSSTAGWWERKTHRCQTSTMAPLFILSFFHGDFQIFPVSSSSLSTCFYN